jgi:peptide/nickel transport system permease protein
MTIVAAGILPTKAAEPPRFLHRLLRRPLALICLIYLAAVVGVAIIAPLALPSVMREYAGNLLAVNQGPSLHHLLGTDSLGRDVLEQLLVGTRATMLGVAEALVVVLALGVPLGLAAGYLGGRTDRVVSWLTDLLFALPAIIIILAVLSVFQASMLAAMVTYGVIATPALIRIVRSAVLPVRDELYIDAARVAGFSQPYIIARHIFPRIKGPVIVQAALLAAGALVVQTSLAYLGLVVKAPAPSWGGMVADGLSELSVQPWLIWPGGVLITITTLSFAVLGDVVRDVTTESWSTPVRHKRRRRPRAQTEQTTMGLRAQVTSRMLAIEGLTVVFPSPVGDSTVVEDVTFDIDAGETVGLVGESGCGKTVTATSILGLIPGGGEITAGRILFDGRDLAVLAERDMERIRGGEIALISQEPMVSLNPVFRIGWQLAQALRLHNPGLSRRQARVDAVELLRRVHLPEPELVARRYPHQLSGGMAQRVAIARAIAGKPKLLIADEPTTALDVTVQGEILDLLRELQREQGMAILLVTHDWGVVADICHRVVVMYAGQLVERSDLKPIFQQPKHPYTEALLDSNPHNAVEAMVLPTIPGGVPSPGDWPRGCHFHPRCRYTTDLCLEHRIALEEPAPGRETRCIHHEMIAAR